MSTPVVLITGALTGIGRATAIAFAREGARIVISGRRDEVGQKLVAELRDIGAEAEYWRSDVRHDDDVRDLVDKTVKRFGRLDIAVNHAGTEGKAGPVTEQTAESYRCNLRHQRPRRAAEHEACAARDAAAGQLEHRQCFIGLWKRRRSRRSCLRGE